MLRASAAEPKVLALVGFPAGAIEAGLKIIVGVGFCQEEFAFPKRSKGYRTPGVRALLQHMAGSNLLRLKYFGQGRG